MLVQGRKDKQLSLVQLSKMVDIKPQVLHAIEKGTVGVNANRAKAVSNVFNKPIEYFFVPTYYRLKKYHEIN